MNSIVALLLTLFCLGYVLSPFVLPGVSRRFSSGAREERNSLLAALKEVELEYELERISEDEFHARSTEIKGQLGSILQELDNEAGDVRT